MAEWTEMQLIDIIVTALAPVCEEVKGLKARVSQLEAKQSSPTGILNGAVDVTDVSTPVGYKAYLVDGHEMLVAVPDAEDEEGAPS